MNINQYAVYQLKESAELAAYRSRSYQYLTEHHFQVIVQNYQQAYFTKLFISDTPEMIRKRLEEHRPKNFRGRPFGVGDVIVINQQGEITAYFVDKDSLARMQRVPCKQALEEIFQDRFVELQNGFLKYRDA